MTEIESSTAQMRQSSLDYLHIHNQSVTKILNYQATL